MSDQHTRQVSTTIPSSARLTSDELRSALEVLGWTQAELARVLGVTHGTVSHWMMQRHICEGPPALCIRMLLERLQDSPCKIATSEAQ